jgi:hypothetical protein
MKQWIAKRWFDLLWLLLFGLASSAWCITAAGRLGATFDEPLYVKAGLISWRTGSNKLLMRAGTMTLPVDVQTLPLHAWEMYRGEPFDPEKDLHLIQPAARAANLIFWWLLLVYAMKLGRTFGGTWGGRLAVAFCACDPSLLGHAALATTDIAAVACLLVLVHHFWHGLEHSWPRRVLLPGVCYGLAVQAKVSGLVFGMEAMVVLGLWHLARSGHFAISPGGWRSWIINGWQATARLRKDLGWISFIALVLVFTYTGCDWGPEPTFITWAESLPEGSVKSVMLPVSRNLTIFTNAGEGLLYQVKHNIRGHGTFLLGNWYPRATPAYFPLVLTMKLPEPVFLLLALVLATRPRGLLTPPGAIALLFLALSPTYRVQIGVRFLFPLIVLGYIALAVAIARSRGERRGLPPWVVAACVSTMAATSLWVWPHGLSYFNQLWGGPECGEHLLHDSNVDWGQGLPELKEWCERNGQERIAVWYYGTDPAVDRPPFSRIHLSHLIHDGNPGRIRDYCGTPLLAVSIGDVHGNIDVTAQHRAGVDWLAAQAPIARTRYFLIYRLRE